MMSNTTVQAPIPPAALSLGLAGLIPFCACALSQWVQLPHFSPEQGFQTGAAYGAVILSFLGGIRWGVAVKEFENNRQSAELAGSVLPSLVGWLSLLLSPIIGVSLLIAGFLVQALWDVLSVEKDYLPQWFGKLRMLLTLGAVLSLSSMLVHLTIS